MNSFPVTFSRLALTSLIALALLETPAFTQGASEPSAVEDGSSAVVTESAGVLVGHWRKTVVRLELSVDYHLILNGDGTFQEWVVTAAGTDAPTSGRWKASDSILMLHTDGSEPGEAPWFIHEGQLVFPNVEGNSGGGTGLSEPD